MLVKAIKTRIFKEGEDLLGFIVANIPSIEERSIIFVTSKIVALAERRVVLKTSERTKIKLIKQESQWAMKTKYTWLTIKDNKVLACAGIDESNAAGKLILLPRDSFKTAAQLRKKLQLFYKVRHLGIVITDSRLLPLRAGTVGVALGYAGFIGRKDYENTFDLFGRKFEHQRTDVADSLATAAVLTMGEGKERCPLAIVTKAPIKFSSRINRRELDINPADDIYRPLFQHLRR